LVPKICLANPAQGLKQAILIWITAQRKVERMNKAFFKRVFFEEQALDYPAGKAMYDKLKVQGYDIGLLKSHNRVTGIPGKTPRESFFQGKSTLVVGVRKTLDFAPCNKRRKLL
jgi:hypothetical protein